MRKWRNHGPFLVPNLSVVIESHPFIPLTTHEIAESSFRRENFARSLDTRQEITMGLCDKEQ